MTTRFWDELVDPRMVHHATPAQVVDRLIAHVERHLSQWIGITGVLTHRASRVHAVHVCEALDIEPAVEPVYDAIEFNDVLAAAFARLNLLQSPRRLPGRDESEHGWHEYIGTWRPGAVKRDPVRLRAKWGLGFAMAWQAVQDV